MEDASGIRVVGFGGFVGFFYPMRGKWQGHILPITYEGLGKTQETNKTHEVQNQGFPLEEISC